MKQEVSTAESKALTFHHSPVPATRARVPRPKDASRFDSPNGVSLSPGSKARPRPSPPEANHSSRVRRPIFPTRPKQGVDNMGGPKEREIEDSKIKGQLRSHTTERYAQVRHYVDVNRKGLDYESDGKIKDDLQRRLNVSESMVKELQYEVSSLKAQLEKLQGRNALLESENIQFVRDLSSAKSKIKVLEKHDQVEFVSKDIRPPSQFEDVRELISNKLDIFSVKRRTTEGDNAMRMQSLAPEPGARSVKIQPKVQVITSPPFQTAPVVGPPPPPSRAAPVAGPPPPPPPPPPRTTSLRTNTTHKGKGASLVEFYHSMTTTKRDGKKTSLGSGSYASPVAHNARNSIVDELQNRSAHLQAIKADVEKKKDFINHLIHKIQSTTFTDIEDVLTFIHWLDGQLSTLADERAVLKHFNWPERKADALREAALEYRDLKELLADVSSFEDDISVTYEVILKKITTLLDKCERSTQRLIKLRDSTMLSYRDSKIPMDWTLDSGIICKIKLASVNLAKIYIKRVSTELELARHSERESVQETLLFQGVRFAYRAYQFAGGLDSETMRAFEELRDLIQLNRRGSNELLQSVRLP